MRWFFVISNTVDTSKPLSLNSLTGYGRLDVLCRCINAAFFLSNTFRKDVILCIYFWINDKIMEIWGNQVHGINPDERAIAGVLKRVFNGYSHPGIRFYSSDLEHFLQKQKFIIIDERGDHSLHLLNEYDSYLLGDQMGFPKQINAYFSNQPKLSLGNSTYLSSQVITILNYLLDKIKPDK
jgi:tRNA (pseudouridine54-N1)-methyltransferase